MGCLLCEARQDAPQTGIRGPSSRSSLGHDPRKEEQGAFHLPQASPGHQASRIPAACALPPKPAFSTCAFSPAPPHTLDGLAPAPGTRTVREYVDAEGRPWQGSPPRGREARRRRPGTCCGANPFVRERWGKRPGPWNSGGAWRRGRAWGLAVWLPAPPALREAKLLSPARRLGLGAGSGMR